MDLFISWSGERSRALAITLREWLPRVLQPLKPWVSSYELYAGARWSDKIGNALSKNSIGLICVTPENQNSPWLLFEAGALSKQMEEAKICPILFGMKPSDLKGPLSQFQAIVVSKPGMLKLCSSLNTYLGENKIGDNILHEEFNNKWPKFEEMIEKELGASTMVIDSAMFPSVLDALATNGLPKPILGETAHFDSGFESHALYKTITQIAKKRLYIFGRKNRKLFDKEYKEFFNSISSRIDKDFDFRCLFLDPASPDHVLSSAHQDDNFPEQLNVSIRNAINFLSEAHVDSNKICRTYKIQRHSAIIVVDDAILYTPIEVCFDGKVAPITKSAFSITGADSPNGQRYIDIFNSVWESGKPIGESVL